MNEIKCRIVWRIAIQMKKRERGYSPHASSICDGYPKANASVVHTNRKPHRTVGLSRHITFGLAVVLTLLVLLSALAWPRRLLLLLLTRFLLAAALLLSALLLTTLLLLARLLVWILIHCTSSPTLVRSAISIACAPWQWTMRGGCIRSRSRVRETLMKMCSELAGGAVSFSSAYWRSEQWDAICCCGCLECRFRFSC